VSNVIFKNLDAGYFIVSHQLSDLLSAATIYSGMKMNFSYHP